MSPIGLTSVLMVLIVAFIVVTTAWIAWRISEFLISWAIALTSMTAIWASAVTAWNATAPSTMPIAVAPASWSRRIRHLLNRVRAGRFLRLNPVAAGHCR